MTAPARRHSFFLRGTFAPARRASDKPIAIACLRLLTVLPERPLFSSPRLRSCIARLTLLAAFFPYLAMWTSFGKWSALLRRCAAVHANRSINDAFTIL